MMVSVLISVVTLMKLLKRACIRKFRGKEEDEESASDWDDLTPKSSPHLRTGAGNRSTGSPHSRGPSPSPTITHPPSTLLVQKEADSHESAIPKRMVLRKADTLVCNAPLTSIAGVKTPQPPPIKTPPNAKPVYLLNSEEGTRQILKEMSPGVSGGTDRMDEGVQKNEEERMVFNEDPPGNEEKKFMSMEEGYRYQLASQIHRHFRMRSFFFLENVTSFSPSVLLSHRKIAHTDSII